LGLRRNTRKKTVEKKIAPIAILSRISSIEEKNARSKREEASVLAYMNIGTQKHKGKDRAKKCDNTRFALSLAD